MNNGQAGGTQDRYNGEVQGSLPVIWLDRLHAGQALMFGMSDCLTQGCLATSNKTVDILGIIISWVYIMGIYG